MRFCWTTFICLTILGMMLGLMLDGVLLSDDDPYKAMENCGEQDQHILWRGWLEPYREYDLHITEDEFRASMLMPHKRCENKFGLPYRTFLTPQNEHIKEIADYLCGLTESEYLRAQYALNFTQCAVEYALDEEIYGIKEHFATPIETLYIGKGDCEDKAFLTCSIMLAMGLDAKITDEPEHIGVALHLKGLRSTDASNCIVHDDKPYYICDITSSHPTRLFIVPTGNERIIDEDPSVSYWINSAYETMLASLKYGGSQYLDRFGIERGTLKNLF